MQLYSHILLLNDVFTSTTLDVLQFQFVIAEEEPTDVHGQDQNRRPSAYSSAIYDLPSSGFVSEEPMASTEVCMHIYDLPLSPASKETFHVPKLGQSPQQVRHNATNSSSLPEGQGYMMRINGAYGSQTT